ncbi:MAG: single-stranded-DNA-specific exonuclease RecJ [Nitrospirae bacterium]|nr:single-stranded-DNA-specific exonuclease RecJ [Nitrospirota bacterium]MBI5695541.1 single-stranded-DNA-specific exonuclease RecJ [Nitrospirota bacterium]
MLAKRWIKQEASPSLTGALCQGLGVSSTTARILVNRGIITPEAADVFMKASLDDLVEPFTLKDMDRVVARVIRALRADEKVLIYGDYDADGICATSLLLEFFKSLGKEASYYIPKRLEEGYGITLDALSRIKDSGVKLIITVDCGISSVDEVDAANSMGIDVIITDHHEPPGVLPNAHAILNPCLKDSGYPFTGLAGVGVALKLAQGVKAGLEGRDKAGPGIHPDLVQYLDIVALGTIADVVPLMGENRILVRHGLKLLRSGDRVGIRKLKEVSRLGSSNFTASTVGFQVAPRLNASGRLGRADVGVKLLTTEDPYEAEMIADELDAMNRDRQKIETGILEDARAQLAAEFDPDAYTIVLASDTWHQGVIGIVASKIVERYFRPTILISMNDAVGKGSARSIPAFHLYNGLEQCSRHLDAFGGHKFAAGLSIRRDNLEAFKTEFEEVARKTLTPDDFKPSLRVDAELALSDLTWEFYDELSALTPFGTGNPEPTLQANRLDVLYPKVVGANHVRMRLAQDGAVMGCIGFNMGDIYQSLAMGRVVVDAAFSLEMNEWQGEKKLQLNLKDIHF